MRSISPKLCVRLFTLCKFRPQFCESCGATYRQICEMLYVVKHIWSRNRCRKRRPNRCIIGDAILHQTGIRLTKNAVLNLALYCGAIWRHREKPQYRCTMTVHPVYNCSRKILESLLPVGLSVRTNLFIPSRFRTTNTKFDSCCQRYYSDMRKNLYRCTSTVLALNYCSRFFSNPSAIYTKWCAQTFPPIFGLFAIFDRNFAKIVAPPSDEYAN